MRNTNEIWLVKLKYFKQLAYFVCVIIVEQNFNKKLKFTKLFKKRLFLIFFGLFCIYRESFSRFKKCNKLHTTLGYYVKLSVKKHFFFIIKKK